MRSLAKIKSSRISEISLLYTNISKSHPCLEFSTSRICVLTLFANIFEFIVYFPYRIHRFYVIKLLGVILDMLFHSQTCKSCLI